MIEILFQNCSSITEQVMTCPIPNLTQILRIYDDPTGLNKTYHPGQVPMETKSGCTPPETGDKKLSTKLSTENDTETSRSKRGLMSRETRDSGSDWEVNHKLEFYIGFQLDGVKDYRNLSTILPTVGKLEVFRDPVLYQFEGKDNIKDFYPGVDVFLDIKVCIINGILSARV